MHFWRRIKPYFLLFLGIETLMRAMLLAVEWRHIDSLHQIASIMVSGFLFDALVFVYFLIPFALYLFLLPARQHGSKIDRFISAAFYGLLAYILLFTSTAEWFFWDEFAARFNFIAVDYLVYTHEVIGNIRESYPVMPLMASVLLLSIGLICLRFRRPLPAQQPILRQRFGLLAVSLALAAGSYFAVDGSKPPVDENRFANEIAKNGIYELFSAYRHNELPYGQFYATGDEKILLPLLRSEIGGDFTNNGIERRVDADGPEKRYNIVMLTVESFSADYMAAFGNEENLTPYLDQLAKESLVFTNLYATGTRTVYGLSSLTLSIPPLLGNAIVRRPDNEHLASLGSILRHKGYDCAFMYGGFGYFDNMNYFFENNHYRIVDRTDLKPEEISFANIWGVADEDLYRRVIKENDASFASGKPFFNMILTTSNHRPFTYPDGKIDIPSGTGRRGGVKYSDYAIRQFIETARGKPWFKDTIFVIVGDHTAGGAGKSELDPNAYHVPLIVYAPGIVKPGKIDNLASQIDVAPTLLGMLNADYESSFYGRDLLRNPPQRALISNYQKLGYLTPESLVILGPVKQANTYSREGERFLADASTNLHLKNIALSYFQNANNWKLWNREVERH
jgi:phosphoglycerol transferase MdoB-like AlkP superfamily enzyme